MKYCAISAAIFAILVSSCVEEAVQESHPTVAQTLGTGPQECFDPAENPPGAPLAIPNDTVDDSAAIQYAIEAAASEPHGGVVCLGAGRFRLTKPSTSTYGGYSALAVRGNNIAIRGHKEGTQLALVGDAANTSALAVNPGSTNISISDISIETTESTNYPSYGISIGNGSCGSAPCGPVQGVILRNIRIDHESLTPPLKRGDCIRIVGQDATNTVTGVTMVSGHYRDCARSAIAIGKYVSGLTVSSNVFEAVPDYAIDLDAAASGVSGLVISSNVFWNGTGLAGDHAIDIAGAGNPVDDVAITGNSFFGRGIKLSNTRNVTITGNTINAAMTTSAAVVDAIGRAHNVTFVGNTIRRLGAAGPVVRTLAISGNRAEGFLASANVLEQNTVQSGFDLQGAADSIVSGNRLRWTQSAPAFWGVLYRANLNDIGNLSVSDNAFSVAGGSINAAVYVLANPNNIGKVVVTGNISTGTTFGIRCAVSPGKTIAPILSLANSIGPRSCTATTFVTGD
jgi:hypothetical protein